jgi:hypothetical protein
MKFISEKIHQFPKTQICSALPDACFGPKADIRSLVDYFIEVYQKKNGLKVDCWPTAVLKNMRP